MNSTINLYYRNLKKSLLSLKQCWIIIPASFALFVLFIFLSQSLSLFGSMAGGFILAILADLALSFYYRWIYVVIRDKKISFNELIQFDKQLFFKIIGISFFLWILQDLFIYGFSKGVQKDALFLPLNLIVVILLNALPETTYLEDGDAAYSFSKSVEFIKENWIEWFIPIVLMLSPLLAFYSPKFLLLNLAGLNLLLPGFSLATTWSYLPTYSYLLMLFTFILAHWFMIFRGFLYQELSTTTKRKRDFQARA